MATITLHGELDPVSAFDIRRQLVAATSGIRPLVDIDLTAVTSIHVAVVASLIDGARRARLRGGELRITQPVAPEAQRELGLASWFPPRSFDEPTDR